MAMTLVNAKIYVARIIGGGANAQEILDMAGEAIQRTYLEWQAKKFWRFLLKDTTNPTSVTGVTATVPSATVNAPSAGAFDFVNVGQTVTIAAADTAALVAGTTVSTVTRGSDGVVTSITLSNAFTGTTDTNSTLTFSANIPITAGVNDYGLPNDFMAPFTCRLLTNHRTMAYRDQRWWDRTILNQDIEGTPQDYTVYNTYSELTQNYGTARMKFDRIPAEADTMLLRYYRKFNTTATNIDIPDEFLYQFLDYARNILLETKRAQDDPAGYAASVNSAAQGAAEHDEQVTDDDDLDVGMKSQYEVGHWNRQLWSNGDFDPYR